jgi:DNA-binding NtrC family response regulator
MEDDRMDATELVREYGTSVDPEVLGAAASDVCILFIGPGSPRELARRVHTLGRGRRGQFRVLDCGWPESLIEEHLLHALRPGASGTVYLEEVGRLSSEMQGKLLQLIDARTTGDGLRRTRARVMASTSEPLIQRVLEGTFNERLFYRLNAIQVVVAPDLDER